MPEPDSDPNPEAAAVAAAEGWIVEQVLSGQLSTSEAAKRLGVSAGAVLRLTRKHTNEDPADSGIAPEAAPHDPEKLAENWERAQEGFVPEEEELPPLDAAIQSVTPARWLLGTEKRRTLTACIACGTLVVGVFAITQMTAEPEPEAAQTEPPISLPDSSDGEMAAELARGFLAATSWQGKLEFVRKKSTVEPLMRDWYEERGQPLAVIDSAQFVKAKSTFIGDTPFVILETATVGDLNPYVLAVDLSSTPALIDWESHVHYQPMSWERFKKERPTSGVSFRVRFEPSDYYAAPFEDPKEYLSAKLTSPHAVVGLNGFIRRGSEAAVRLQHIAEFAAGRNITATLKFNRDSQSPVVEIVDIQEGWLSP